jgi:nucleotide-binding universal stress UspA family protein
VDPQSDSPFELGTDGPTSILVGVDGSVTSARAVFYAAGLARRQQATVTIVYVTPRTSLATSLGVAAGHADTVQREGFEQAALELRAKAAEFARELGVQVTFLHAWGDPFTELTRTAEEIRADAVVVGASTQAGHRLIGSLAVRLVKASRWPVTVVP